MKRIRHAARRSLPLAVLVPAAALTAAGPSPASENGGSSGEGAKPTVVLVHGAWAADRAAVLGGAAALPVAGGTALVVRSRRA